MNAWLKCSELDEETGVKEVFAEEGDNHTAVWQDPLQRKWMGKNMVEPENCGRCYEWSKLGSAYCVCPKLNCCGVCC